MLSQPSSTSQENILKPNIQFTTLDGKLKFNLHPVPMTCMPSCMPSPAWMNFLMKHVAETELSNETIDRIQDFMIEHNTEALSDGVTDYTIAGNSLAYCNVEPFRKEKPGPRMLISQPGEYSF